jgi:hypothetical protein
MRFEFEFLRYQIPISQSRDEYPFACCVEGGSSTWIGHIPPHENSAQGGLIAAFLKRHKILPNNGEDSKFEVRVINYRKA